MMASIAMAQTAIEVTDEALAAAASQGDREAFSVLVARYRKVVFACAYARLRHRDEAEDIAQEAFVRAYLSLDGFRSSACWGAWLMRILRNLCNDALRRRRVRRFEPVFDEVTDPGSSPEMLALAGERRRELSAAVADLPEKNRVPLLMHYGSGRTYREIALALDLPESTIVGRLAGALRLLRRRMGAEGKR